MLHGRKSTILDESNDTDSNEISMEENVKRKRPCDEDLKETFLDNSIKKENEMDTKESDTLANKKPRLSGDDYLKLKQELRERKKKLKTIPRFRLKAVGESASLTINVKSEDRIPIFLSDVQHLLLYSLHGHHSPYMPTRWCHLEKYNRVAHTVVLVVEGLSLYHFMAYENMFPHITSKLEHRVEVVTPTVYGGSVIEELAAVPITGIQSDKLLKKYGSLEAALRSSGDVIKLLRTVFPMHGVPSTNAEKFKTKYGLPGTDKFPRTKLLLSLCQMVEENYPVPLKGELAKKYGNYIMTKDVYVEANERSPMIGLDCEMCKTTSGELELTRISLVDESMKIIYDSLVKPDNPIMDYLTRFSGITKDMLEGVTTTLSDVQQILRKLLPPDAILVGQSLNSDLHTLKMMHPYIIDTSVIFNITGDRYRKSKLQTLVREFLGERIQENISGHCSTEDSQASMKLVQLKLANSVDFGDAVLLGCCNMEILKMEPEKMTDDQRSLKTEIQKYATSIFKYVVKDKKTAAIVGNGEVMNEYSKYLTSSINIMDDENFSKNDQVRLVIADNDKQAVLRASQIAMEHAFTLCHVKIEQEKLKNDKIQKTFRTVNKWVHKLWQHMAMNGLACIIFTGENNAANGACFLNLKKEISEDCTIHV
ncbi:small RNA degrading nuclease 5 isoform X3 [Frieseomelitta varia]|uniref:small RNA degrading nuclease 5 isoform X3 n=1 Tax=Frieseomelitta varia TaxID=561572 RepID=UPI001CB67963|nr:small RNA degrading nuclease 5 isoform X3 [Frieseomelitta varia]